MSKRSRKKKQPKKKSHKSSSKSTNKSTSKSTTQAQAEAQARRQGMRAAPLFAGLACIAAGAFLMWINWNTSPPKDPASTSSSSTELAADNKNSNKPSDGRVASQAAVFEEPIELPTIPGVEKNRFDRMIVDVARLEDPVLDGWDTESFEEVASKQFKQIGHLLEHSHELADADLSGLIAESFATAGLRPVKRDTAFQDDSLSVQRGETAEEHTGVEGFRNASLELSKLFEGASDQRFKVKTIRVALDPETKEAETKSYFEISGRTKEQATQVNAVWTCKWASDDRKHPLLKSVDVEDYEEVVCKTPNSHSMFVDCTESVFRNTDRFQRQLRYGIDYWTDQFDGAIARPAAGHGMAIDDVNGDGLEDVYLCQSPALPNLLLLQQPDGTIRDAAVEMGVHWLEGTRAALFADLDNDGDQDLVCVLGSYVVVQENDGAGHFKEVTTIQGVSSLFAINAVDFDNDSDLDLFICGYTLTSGVNPNDVFANPMPFHDATNGAPNILLRNDGNWGFTDVTEEVGLSENSMRFSYASSWDDFDNDGDQDLYVANDFGRNNLYRNDGGKFVDVGPELEVEDIGPGMSASWGDYNNDGKSDLYVSNMFSSAGNRITHQSKFKNTLDEKTKGYFQRHARGNSLFENAGSKFQDRSVGLGVTLGRWAWGSQFVDINNDGWEDLYVTNGFVTADDTNDL